MASKAAVLRLIPQIRANLSSAHGVRLEKVLELIDTDGRAVLAEVLSLLYPRQSRTAALTAFRQFRQAVSLAAEEAGVQLSLETDRQTRAHPNERVAWYEAEDRVSEEVKRMVESEVADVKRTPQDVEVQPVIRFFISYAHKNAELKKKLISRLQTWLNTCPHAQFELWADGEIQPGQRWRNKIQEAMESCDFGLLLISPEFLESKFITRDELPFLINHKQIIPIALKPVLFDGSMDLKGLEERLIFFAEGQRSFSDLAIDRTQGRFAMQLFQAITKLVAEKPETTTQPATPRLHRHLRWALGEFDETRFVHPEGVISPMQKEMEGNREPEKSKRKDAVEFLLEWVTDKKAQPYCALLGEYGMGKTTTCKALARELLNRLEKGEKAPLPIYLDLRNVGAEARRGLVLSEILDLILRNSWKSGEEATSLTAREIIHLVQKEGALVIWDGLDEVLVHLDPDPGRKFTRQLFRILPPWKKGEHARGRMLISCRTHYFRTLRDQQTHFRAEDRDNIRPEDYRPPFLLLPFTLKQIREYLVRSLPDEDPERVINVFKSVHNLTEMAERPYTLSLITSHFEQIERWKMEGRRVTGLMLYRHMVLSWLERDQGKHQLTTDHKQALMEYFAAELWRTGTQSWSVADLEQWLINFLRERPDFAAHYEGKDRELLKEDLRTATFLVREGEDRFRFAHTSLQEYFLAGYLRRALIENRVEAWALPNVSPETLDFLGQWLLEEKEQRSVVLRALKKLRDNYRTHASELAFAYFLLAIGKDYPAPSAAEFQLPGANLDGLKIAGAPEKPLMLAGINLKGAQLWHTRWRGCNLEAASFDGAGAVHAEWRDCYLAKSTWKQAELEGAIYRECDLEGANFQDVVCQRTQWQRCNLTATEHLPSAKPHAFFVLCDRPPKFGAIARPLDIHLQPAAGHYGGVNGCAWSPDGKRIVSGAADNSLRVWEAETGRCLLTLTGHEDSVMGCAWSPDGKRIISASCDRTLRLWDARSGQCLATFSGHGGEVNCCAWAPDGKRILSASDDKSVRVWDVESGQCLITFCGHEHFVSSCAWSPDGDHAVSASYDNCLRVWNVNSGRCDMILSGHKGYVRSCAWSPDGKRIASVSSDRSLRIWDSQSGRCLATLLGHENELNDCAWSPDGECMVSACRDGSMRVWDGKTASCLMTLTGHEGSVWSCAWSPDGKRIVAAAEYRGLRIWEVESGRFLVTLSGDEGSVVLDCAWSPDGRRIVSGSDDSSLRVWEADSGCCLLTLTGHKHWVASCAWSPDGRRIVSGSYDQSLRVWEAESGHCLLTLTGHEGSVWGCAWSPDGRRIVSGSYDRSLRVWEAETGRCLLTLTGHQGSLRGCAWSPDGRRIVSCADDNSLRVWEAETGRCLLTLTGYKGSVRGCAWSPDGKRIVSGSKDDSVRVWDAESGHCLLTLTGHGNSVLDCAWSPDGKRIVSCADDNSLRVWDAESGHCLLTLTGHQGSVTGCAWSPDGKQVLSCAYDGTLRLWDAQNGIQISPEIHTHRTPERDLSWYAIDRGSNRILACDVEAWRYLGWVVPDETGMPEWLPAEMLGPLPVEPVPKKLVAAGT